MSKQKNKSNFKAESMAELQERGVLVVEIPASAAEVVLTLELKLERDKTGDVGKFRDTYIIHISKFMIARDHTLKFPIHFRYKDRLANGQLLVFDIFLFNYVLRQTGTRHF